MHSETSLSSADRLVQRSASRLADMAVDMAVRAPFRKFKEWLQHGGRWPRFPPVSGGLPRAQLTFQQGAKAHLETLLETGRPIPPAFRDNLG